MYIRDDIENFIQQWLNDYLPSGVDLGDKERVKSFVALALKEALKEPSDRQWKILVKQYCSSNIKSCPLCEAPLVQRKSKAGKPFFGCSTYPVCAGIRFTNGDVALNEEAKTFLKKKVEEKQVVRGKSKLDNLEF